MGIDTKSFQETGVRCDNSFIILRLLELTLILYTKSMHLLSMKENFILNHFAMRGHQSFNKYNYLQL